MVEIKIELKNSKRIQAAFRQAPNIMVKELDKGIKATAVMLVGKTKKHVTQGTRMFRPPIDTGALRQNIGLRSAGRLTATIGVNPIVDYATYVHDGTFKMKARPFFEITAKEEEKAVGVFFNKYLQTAVNKITKISG